VIGCTAMVECIMSSSLVWPTTKRIVSRHLLGMCVI
jgi:hypothetical protein